MSEPVPFPDGPVPPSAGIVHAATPRPSRLRRKALGIGLVVAGLVASLLLVYAVRPPTRKERPPPDMQRYGESPNGMHGLPANYSQLKPPVLPAAIPVPPAPSPRQPAAVVERDAPAPARPERKETDAEKAAKEAQTGDIFFKKSGGSSGQRTAVAVTPPYLPTPDGQDPSTRGQERRPTAEEAKGAFVQRASTRQETMVQDRLHAPESPYMVMAGKVIPIVLEFGINSDLPGPVKARVREPVYDSVTGQHLLIPQGTEIIGIYDSDIVPGQNRVLVVWQRLLFQNGYSLQLDGMPGVDLSGYAGVPAKVDNHWFRLLGAVILSSVLSVGAQVPFGDVEGYYPTLGQQFAQDFGRAANQAGQKIVQRELNIKPTLKRKPGWSMNVFVHKDLILQPYTQYQAIGRR